MYPMKSKKKKGILYKEKRKKVLCEKYMWLRGVGGAGWC
jgi:hypothetical protein